jgi:hypothetical protein
MDSGSGAYPSIAKESEKFRLRRWLRLLLSSPARINGDVRDKAERSRDSAVSESLVTI